MERIREYLISVTAAALLCGVIRSITGDKGLIQLICGIFLILTVIRPMADISIRELSFNNWNITQNARIAVSEGEDYADAAMARHIKEECEAYILDKAEAYDCSIAADFRLNKDLIPEGCTISGSYSAYAREQLADILERDLGIPREDQRWIP